MRVSLDCGRYPVNNPPATRLTSPIRSNEDERVAVRIVAAELMDANIAASVALP